MPDNPQAETAALVMMCSWCQAERGETPGPNETHGMCDTHFNQKMAELFPAQCKADIWRDGYWAGVRDRARNADLTPPEDAPQRRTA